MEAFYQKHNCQSRVRPHPSNVHAHIELHAVDLGDVVLFLFFFMTLEPGVESDTPIYGPSIRALLGTAPHFCQAVVLKLRTACLLADRPAAAGDGHRAYSLLVMLKNSCSELRCQKTFKLRFLSYKLADRPAAAGHGHRVDAHQVHQELSRLQTRS